MSGDRTFIQRGVLAAEWRLRRLAGLPPPAPGDAAGAQALLPMVHAAARAMAAHGRHRVTPPALRPRSVERPLRIGFFGNIANNAYNTVRCLRRLGVDAELVVEDGWFDRFLMNRPFWEDVDVQCSSYEEGHAAEPRWTPVAHVRRVAYDASAQEQFQNRLSAVDEVRAIYQQAFGVAIAPDRALVLAQFMGHWPLISAMQRYDVVQFSGEALTVAAFSPKPVVAYPTGSDLYVSPFEESLSGLTIRAAYTSADAVLAGESAYGAYLDTLRIHAWQFVPLMLDTDRYAPGSAAGVRARWRAAVGGDRFLFGACRQAWRWKGNDILIRAFAAFAERHPAWRLVLQSWGPDLDQSRALVNELRLDAKVHWEPLCSKPVLRSHQQAADLCADQIAYDGACGTSVLEAMAAGKPVIMRPPSAEQLAQFPKRPPFVGAADVDSAARALFAMSDDARRAAAGQEHLAWVRETHGYQSVAPHYTGVYDRLAGGR